MPWFFFVFLKLINLIMNNLPLYILFFNYYQFFLLSKIKKRTQNNVKQSRAKALSRKHRFKCNVNKFKNFLGKGLY